MTTAAVSIGHSSCLLRALVEVQSLRAQIRRELKALRRDVPDRKDGQCSTGSASSTSAGSSGVPAITAAPRVPALALGRGGLISSHQQTAGDQWSAGDLGQRPRALDDLHLSFSNALYESELATVSDEEDWGGWVSASEAEPRPSHSSRHRTPRGTPRITPRSRHGSRPPSRSCSRSCTPGRLAPNTGGSNPPSTVASSQQGRPTPLRSALNKLNAGSAGLGLLGMNSSPKGFGALGSGRSRHSSDALSNSLQGVSFSKLPSRKLLDGVTLKAGSINNTPRESLSTQAGTGIQGEQGRGGEESSAAPMLMHNPTADMGGVSNENSPALDGSAAGRHHSSRRRLQTQHQYARMASLA